MPHLASRPAMIRYAGNGTLELTGDPLVYDTEVL